MARRQSIFTRLSPEEITAMDAHHKVLAEEGRKATEQAMELRNPIIYVAIRRAEDDGHQWADVSTVSGDAGITREKADHLDRHLPQWALANPVQRIGRYRLVEER